MQPIATDGVAWSVSQSVCLSRSWALQKQLNWSWCSSGCGLSWAQEPRIRRDQIPTCEETDPGHPQHSIYSKRLSRGQHRYGAPADWGVLDGGARRCNLANTTEPSMQRWCGLTSNYFDFVVYSISPLLFLGFVCLSVTSSVPVQWLPGKARL